MAYGKKQIKLATNKYFYELKSQEMVCEELGWPRKETLSRWLRHDKRYGKLHVRTSKAKAGKPSRLKYPYEIRAEAVRLAEEEHLTRKEISDRLGLCGAPIVTKWVTIARMHGLEVLVPGEDRKRIRENVKGDPIIDDIVEPKRQNEQSRIDNAILSKTIKILIKTPASTMWPPTTARNPYRRRV